MQQIWLLICLVQIYKNWYKTSFTLLIFYLLFLIDENFNKGSLNPCFFNGTCISQADNTYKCNCAPGYTGTRCTLLLTKQFTSNLCLQNNCYNGGTCNTLFEQNQYTVVCYCAQGFSGSRCQINTNTNFCQCLNNGVCNSNGTCSCQLNYYGVKCELNLNQVSTTTSANSCPYSLCVHGSCLQKSTNSYYCNCVSGWTGSRCDVVLNACQSNNPCQNGATCNPQSNNQFTCSCVTGTYGTYCENSKFL